MYLEQALRCFYQVTMTHLNAGAGKEENLKHICSSSTYKPHFARVVFKGKIK